MALEVERLNGEAEEVDDEGFCEEAAELRRKAVEMEVGFFGFCPFFVFCLFSSVACCFFAFGAWFVAVPAQASCGGGRR